MKPVVTAARSITTPRPTSLPGLVTLLFVFLLFVFPAVTAG
jgi:hypothetical protein